MNPTDGDRPVGRPTTHFDPGVQHERTALAWERTGLATILAGATLARLASTHFHHVLGAVGAIWVAIGGAVLFWTSWRFEALHGPLRAGETPAHPSMARFVGASALLFTGFALVLTVYLAVIDR
ncbi:MAG: DUF202 domain-containing protein [Ilumatobacteraceae bacterium]